jgi:hypothetical protein
MWEVPVGFALPPNPVFNGLCLGLLGKHHVFHGRQNALLLPVRKLAYFLENPAGLANRTA